MHCLLESPAVNYDVGMLILSDMDVPTQYTVEALVVTEQVPLFIVRLTTL